MVSLSASSLSASGVPLDSYNVSHPRLLYAACISPSAASQYANLCSGKPFVITIIICHGLHQKVINLVCLPSRCVTGRILSGRYRVPVGSVQTHPRYRGCRDNATGSQTDRCRHSLGFTMATLVIAVCVDEADADVIIV